MAERAYPALAKEFKKRKIRVEKENFYCRGQFTALHRGHPNAEDLQKARTFVRERIEKAK
jgi:hypothetical protein